MVVVEVNKDKAGRWIHLLEYTEIGRRFYISTRQRGRGFVCVEVHVLLYEKYADCITPRFKFLNSNSRVRRRIAGQARRFMKDHVSKVCYDEETELFLDALRVGGRAFTQEPRS